MTPLPRPSSSQIALAPELALLATLDAVLDLTQRTLDAAWPEPRSADPDEALALHIHRLAEELREAIFAYYALLVDDQR
jgi:hypothetical protein